MSLIHYIGLDVHNDSIAVSIAPSDSTEVRRYGIIGGTHDDVLKLCKKLQPKRTAARRVFFSHSTTAPFSVNKSSWERRAVLAG